MRNLRNDMKLSESEIKRIETAKKIVINVLQELGIDDIWNYSKGKNTELEFQIYKRIDEKNITIIAEVSTEFGIVKLEFPLLIIACNILHTFEKLFSNENAHEVLHSSVIFELKKRNINILKFFKLKESELEENIVEKTHCILNIFLLNIPFFARYLMVDTVFASFNGFCQYVIKKELKDHWEELGLPKNFNFITDTDLDQLRQSNIDQRRFYLGNRKQLLNVEKLADEAEALRKIYAEAKPRYIKEKEEFYSSNKQITQEQRDRLWSDLKFDMFQDLNLQALKSIEERSPSELATIHLADHYGYSEESMRTKIKKSRKLKK